MAQALQILGALLILTAYLLALLRKMDSRAWPYLLLNFFGSALLAVLAGLERQWGFLLLEGIWAVVTAATIIGRLRKSTGEDTDEATGPGEAGPAEG